MLCVNILLSGNELKIFHIDKQGQKSGENSRAREFSAMLNIHLQNFDPKF